MKRIVLLVIGLFIFKGNAQERVISTAVPFLLIAADARSAGMGDVGVATSADGYSQQYNPAKYAFALDEQGISLSYTPYLTALANDINLGQLNYFYRLNERSAFASSLRYFGLGEVQLTECFDCGIIPVNPSELALDVSYSLRLSERFSMAVAGRYIRSALKVDFTGDMSAANTFAVDLAGYYQSEVEAYGDFDGRIRAGFNIQNLGPKISYDGDAEYSSNFIPSNLRLGAGFDFIMDEYNTIGITLETTKLLVPTPQYTEDMTAEERTQAHNDYQRTNWFSGALESFGDAPDGFSEELREFTLGGGVEYSYMDSFALRLGYFNEHETKGARKYFTLGAGFKYNIVKIDVSYLMSTSKVQNPLENTLRFSLTFNFGDKYDEY